MYSHFLIKYLLLNLYKIDSIKDLALFEPSRLLILVFSINNSLKACSLEGAKILYISSAGINLSEFKRLNLNLFVFVF